MKPRHVSKLDRRRRKPLNIRRLRQLLVQHLNDTSLLDGFAYPPPLAEEVARSKYLADKIIAELSSDQTPSTIYGVSVRDQAARIRNLTIINMYRMILAGGIRFCVDTPAPVAAEPTLPGPNDPDQTMTEVQQQKESV